MRIHVQRHLDNAATSSPKPDRVIDAVIGAVTHVAANPGRGSSSAARAASDLVEGSRRVVAEFLGLADPSRLAFTLNATDALSLSLRSLVPAGGRVVTSAMEHAAITRPLARMQRDEGVRVIRVGVDASGRYDPDAVARAARGASCVVLTCASNVTGIVQPFEETAALLERAGVPLVLDAAQAAGTVPLAADGLGPLTAVAVTGHKALLGIMGAGALLVGAELELGPWREGGTGDSLSPLQPVEYPKRLEAGTPPVPAIAGLAAGVAWWREQSPDRVRRREAELAARLGDGLAAIPGVSLPVSERFGDAAPRVPLVLFLVRGYSPDEVGELLDREFGITVRTGLHCCPSAHELLGTHPVGGVRASLGPTTAEEDVLDLIAAVAELARSTPA